MKSRWFWIIAVVLSFYFCLFSVQKINLLTADIGRHIVNGRLFLQTFHTNFYSYTYPDFPFINHHWGSGIIAYLIYRVSGFGGLSFVYILLCISALVFSLRTAKEDSRPANLFLAGLLLAPLFAERTEVRPESVSYLFIALFIFILFKYSKDKIPAKLLWILPAIELLWVNMHIYFIFGLFIIGVFFLEALVLLEWLKAKRLFWTGVFSTLAGLVNPYGLTGLVYPFTIFKNYGYKIVENQSITFLQNYGILNPSFLWYKIAAFLLAGSTIFILVYARKRFAIALTIISATFAVLAFWEIRNLSVFALVSLPLLVYNFSVIRERFFKNTSPEILSFFYILLSFIIVVSTFIHFSSRLPWNREWGFGLASDSLTSAEFIKANGIRGPFFNNYDIGSAMIFSLYPQEKVFVDNRPEAYPADFFQNVYIPMQEDPQVFAKVDSQYHFNAIYFYRLDLTPWAQTFLNHMVRDSAWAPVYVDSKTIIILKRNTENQKIIEKYELPQSIFVTS